VPHSQEDLQVKEDCNIASSKILIVFLAFQFNTNSLSFFNSQFLSGSSFRFRERFPDLFRPRLSFVHNKYNTDWNRLMAYFSRHVG